MAKTAKSFELFCLIYIGFLHWSHAADPMKPESAKPEALNWTQSPFQRNDSDEFIVSRILNRPPKPEVHIDTKWTADQPGSIATATAVNEEESFCRDRYVRGNCRDRDNPFDCDRFQWTAHATIHNTKDVYRIRSFPEGLYVAPLSPVLTTSNKWESRPLRVSLTVSCCTPVVQFLGEVIGAPDYDQTCIVNVNELQGLKVWEYGLIIFASVLVLLVALVGIGYNLVQKRRNQNKSSTNPHHRFRRP